MYRVAITCSFSISAKNICHVLQEEIEKKQLNIEVEAFHTEDCSKVIGNYDLVLLMPQIRYNLKNISKLLKPIETKVITNEQINHINDLLDVIIEIKIHCSFLIIIIMINLINEIFIFFLIFFKHHNIISDMGFFFIDGKNHAIRHLTLSFNRKIRSIRR